MTLMLESSTHLSVIILNLTIEAAKFPPQDVVPVSANLAHEQVTLKSIALQENSAYSIVHTVSPPLAAHSTDKH